MSSEIPVSTLDSEARGHRCLFRKGNSKFRPKTHHEGPERE